MARIQIVGRLSRGRCAACHGDLEARETLGCELCGACFHRDCLKELTDGRCTTFGCTARPGQVAAEPPAPPTPDLRPLDRREREHRRRVLAHAQGLADAHPRPGRLARFGPYSRLILSGVASVLGLTALGTAAVAAAAFGPLLAERLTQTARKPMPLPLFLFVALMLAIGAAVLFLHLVRWLRALPAIFREVRELLDRDRPIPMILDVSKVGEGKHARHVADLEGPSGERLHLDISGFLPPWWITLAGHGRLVWVYGYPPPGPYLIEFENGFMALVHPEAPSLSGTPAA